MTPSGNMLRRSVSFVGMTLMPLLLGAGPAEAKGGNPWQGAGFVLAGPAVLLLCLASMAVVYLIAASLGKQESLVMLAETAAGEAGRGKAVNTLWGILAEILLISAGLVIAKTGHVGLLVVLLLLLALTLAGLGATLSALVLGRRLHAELAGGEVTPLSSISIGLRLLFLAAALPLLGWIVVLLLTANGIGSILATSARGSAE